MLFKFVLVSVPVVAALHASPAAFVGRPLRAARPLFESRTAPQRTDAVVAPIIRMEAVAVEAVAEDPPQKLRSCKPLPHWLEEAFEVVEQGTVPGAMLILATVISLTLANLGPTSAKWLALWATPIGPHIGHHALTVQAWINEGLMAIFFFVVGLEIKQEFRLGSLASVRKAVLPCLAALGGMVTPMGIYLLVQRALPLGSLAALTVPMATDIAFAMGILGFFRKRMPLSASAFLLTLATVDDLGAILVLATCFASNVALPFLAGAGAIFALLGVIGRRGSTDLKIFGAGGFGLWYCLLRSGVNADVAGVLAAMCISTKAMVQPSTGRPERLTERAIRRIAPFTALGVMPLFALANTAVKLGGPAAATAAAASAAAAGAAASRTPALGIAAGLLIGKPLGIFGFTWLADKLGFAKARYHNIHPPLSLLHPSLLHLSLLHPSLLHPSLLNLSLLHPSLLHLSLLHRLVRSLFACADADWHERVPPRRGRHAGWHRLHHVPATSRGRHARKHADHPEARRAWRLRDRRRARRGRDGHAAARRHRCRQDRVR